MQEKATEGEGAGNVKKAAEVATTDDSDLSATSSEGSESGKFSDVAAESMQQIIEQLGGNSEGGKESPIDILKDVDVNVKIELGRAKMYVEDVLKIREGSVIELDKLAGDPVDIYVNDRLVARGEVLVLNDNFCVRINQIVQNS